MASQSAQETSMRQIGKLYFKLDSYLHNSFTIGDFPIQAVPYTTYAELNIELGKPVDIDDILLTRHVVTIALFALKRDKWRY